MSVRVADSIPAHHPAPAAPQERPVVVQAVVSGPPRAALRRLLHLDARPVPATPLAPLESRRDGLLAWSFVLALVCLATKLALLPFPVSTPVEFARWALRLAIVAAPDICFVTLLACGCLAVTALLRRGLPWALAAWRHLCLLIHAFAALYAVASIPMYKVTMVPFTVRLLSFAGGPEVMASSIRPFLPPGIVAALVAGPAAVLLAAAACCRWPALSPRPGSRPRTAMFVTGLLLAYAATCHVYVRTAWTDPNRWERRIAQSPHTVLLVSAAEELLKRQAFTHNYSFQAIDDSDFVRTAADAAQQGPPASPLPPGRAPIRNVVLVVLESTGVEYFGVQGSRFDTTPRLNQLAARQGVVFENVYVQAASSCKSLVALSSSVYPRPDWLLIVRDHPDFDVPTIAQVLKGRGYRTCYAHSGYWSWQGRDKFLKDRGVDKLIGADNRPDSLVNSWGIHDQTMFQEVLDWIDQDPQSPFFALAYTIETHHPYVAPKRMHDFQVADEQLGRYLNAVRATDERIAWLIEELDRRGLAESTLIVVTSDHGESFGQHNQRVHSFGVYEQTVHVPLVLLHPSLARMPRRNRTIAQHIDLPPTILHLLNVPPPRAWQGRSLMKDAPDRRAYFLCVGNEVVLGLRDGRFKYHYYVDTTREELFDLAADPGELANLADRYPRRCAAYRSRVGGLVTYQRAWLAEHGVE